MRLRRSRLVAALGPDEIAPTVVSFPLLGVGDFVRPAAPPGGPASRSDSVPDACINPHPRFAALTENIRSRRGGKVDIRAPLFPDERTEGSEVVMDHMAYGMGCCCLQVTLQARDVDESRHLYDQLAVLAPILLALTAATPILHGRLVGTDARWATISACVDDRTPAERGEPGAAGRRDARMAGDGVRRTAKSRYDSVSAYISRRANASPAVAARLNDVPCEVDDPALDALLRAGVEQPLARHVAYLFARDPLVAFEGSLEDAGDDFSVEHFESLNSTNWQSMRWKPPPPSTPSSPHIGWRTEFRSMELQLTDFENAAFSVFVVLLSRALLAFDLDFLAPLSLVDENMARAHGVDAVNAQKFWFRRDVLPGDVVPGSGDAEQCEEMSMDVIVNGRGAFPGLVPLCYAYLEVVGCDGAALERIDQYLTLISRRASGELPTAATWMRRIVADHPGYAKDSVVTQGIAYDLLRACDEVGRGLRPCPELLGDVDIEPVVPCERRAHSSRSPAPIAKVVDRLWASAGGEESSDSTEASPRHQKRLRAVGQ